MQSKQGFKWAEEAVSAERSENIAADLHLIHVL